MCRNYRIVFSVSSLWRYLIALPYEGFFSFSVVMNCVYLSTLPADIHVHVHMSACLITSRGVFLHSHLSSHPPPSLFLSLHLNTLHFNWLHSHVWFILPRRSSALALSSPSPFPPFSSACLSSCSGHQLFSFITHCLPHLFSPLLWTPKLISAFPLRLLSQNLDIIKKTVVWAQHGGGCYYLLPINNNVTASSRCTMELKYLQVNQDGWCWNRAF